MSFFSNMFSSSKFSKWEDNLSRKGVLRATASGMHSTANGLRATADYIDQKASLLEAKADEIEMKEFAKDIAKRMETASEDSVVVIPTARMNSMTTQEVMDELGVEIKGIASTAY